MRKMLLAAIPALLMCVFVSCGGAEKETAQPFIPPDEVLQPIEAFGIVIAADIREIVLPFPAVIEKLHVTEYQKVGAGDVLVTLDLTEYRSRIAEKEREMKLLQDEIAKSRQSYENEQDQLDNNRYPDIKKLLFELTCATEELEKNLQKLSVKESLYESGAISQQELADFENQVNNHIDGVKDIEHSLELLKYQKQRELTKLQDALLQNTNKLSLLSAELEGLSNKLLASFMKNNQIVSGVSNGIVCDIDFLPGDYVNPQSKILRIMNFDSLVIEAGIDEQFISNVKKDAKVHIIPEADRSHTCTGKVCFISSAAENMNGETTVPVVISIDDPDGFLLPNFNVELMIEAN